MNKRSQLYFNKKKDWKIFTNSFLKELDELKSFPMLITWEDQTASQARSNFMYAEALSWMEWADWWTNRARSRATIFSPPDDYMPLLNVKYFSLKDRHPVTFEILDLE